MTIFLRHLEDKEKATNLLEICRGVRRGAKHGSVFQVDPDSFTAVPGAPFAYWISDAIRQTFKTFPTFECSERTARVGLQTSDDFRFVRACWEVNQKRLNKAWCSFAKGGAFSPFYSDVYLVVFWEEGGRELDGFTASYIRNPDYYFQPGVTWPSRTQQFGARVLPSNSIFGHKGPTVFQSDHNSEMLLVIVSMMASRAFESLVEISLNAGDKTARSYEVGIIQNVPFPKLNEEHQSRLSVLGRRAWSLKRNLDTVEETSHAFILPTALRARLGSYHPQEIEIELTQIQSEIDAIAFDSYGFSEDDRAAMQSGAGTGSEEDTKDDNDQSYDDSDDSDDENGAAPIDDAAGLLSWAVGVAFGRFDWRLATAEREVPEEPEPFDPLPTKSPGMLPDDAEPFHAHAGILVDDEGHSHDLPYLLEEVLQRVDAPVQVDTRRWLERDFFKFHLKQYSKSRRKAPIYWPLSTGSCGYTLWIYYPSLTDQTLFTAVNDFIEPKLKQVGQDVAALRTKGSARSGHDEKNFELLQALELELIELRDTLLVIAQNYSPNHDDGVQITAALLWPLFRHKPWQKVLKDTWAKLENGDYDWAHLAYSYWPDRVREKCKTDKSLGIAHGLEDLYEEPAA